MERHRDRARSDKLSHPHPTRQTCDITGCLNDCYNSQGHGTCLDARKVKGLFASKCKCAPGWYGVDCSRKACLPKCDGNSQCYEGRCICIAGFSGPECKTRSCGVSDLCGGNGKCVRKTVANKP